MSSTQSNFTILCPPSAHPSSTIYTPLLSTISIVLPLTPSYAAAVVDKYIRTKLRRSRSRKYITEKLETLEKQVSCH